MKKADYRKIASFYDKGRSLPDEIISLWMKLISRYAGDSANTRILDLGCGTGRFTVAIANQLGYCVTGVDMSDEMLAEAKVKDINNLIQWDHQDAQSLTYDDESFDVIFISHLLHHVDSPVLVLKEARRVLVSSGVILIRYGAIEQIEHDVVHTFFPEALEIDKARTPLVLTVESWLKETGFTGSKTLLRSFIKRIVINGDMATIYYKLPMPPNGKKKQSVGVLPIVTPGGAGISIGRNFALTFSISI